MCWVEQAVFNFVSQAKCRHFYRRLPTSVSRFPTVHSEFTLSEHDERPSSMCDIVVIVSTSEQIAEVLFASSVLTACSLDLMYSNSSASTVFNSDLNIVAMSSVSDVRIFAFISYNICAVIGLRYLGVTP